MIRMECRLIPSALGFVCVVCGKPAKQNVRRVCRLNIIDETPVCPMNGIVPLLTESGVGQLQRCRDAECGLMRKVEGTIRCTGMGGGKCTWIPKWAGCLNGEREWPNGTTECPHWITSTVSEESPTQKQ